jgi:hypothetical protein
MPLDEKVLGFSNRWYQAAMKSAVTRRLADDIEIRVVTASSTSPRSSRRSKVAEREICSEVVIWKT